MKIALLGASKSGKTVYFSGLNYKFRNSIAFIPLSPSEIRTYRSINVSRRVGFKISVRKSDLENTLSKNIQFFTQKPIIDWPPATDDIDKSRIDCFFKFSDVSIEGLSSIDSHRRTIELFDPTGGALSGFHEHSDDIVSELCTCDVSIAFLPANIIVECVESEDIDALQNNLLLGKIVDIVMEARKSMADNDILPVCFVVSKADILANRNENFIKKMNHMLYDQIILPFSRENPNIMLCVCPTSVVDPETGNFRASNLEWPFLFAAGGTIFRNSVALRGYAQEEISAARQAENRADEIKQQGWWKRFKLFVQGDGVGRHRKLAIAHRDKFGRFISEAEDDRDLAKSAWSSLAIEGKARGVRIFMEGEEIDPRLVTG